MIFPIANSSHFIWRGGSVELQGTTTGRAGIVKHNQNLNDQYQN